MRRKERETTDKSVIEKIISKADVCRIAIANDNMPYIVTMNFGYSDVNQSIYFHCANEGRKLEMIKKNNLVCFEMDVDHEISSGEKVCDWGMKYSSVVGYGYISIIPEGEAKKTGLDCIMEHYGGKGKYVYDEGTLKRTTILRLDITAIKGKIC